MCMAVQVQMRYGILCMTNISDGVMIAFCTKFRSIVCNSDLCLSYTLCINVNMRCIGAFHVCIAKNVLVLSSFLGISSSHIAVIKE